MQQAEQWQLVLEPRWLKDLVWDCLIVGQSR
jgi:hypothetical protein